ncbi:MAG: fold metallo-hydrolase [Candidatus Eremiobacteraeota bacterium]|jgi:8-oxo-dGTP pyrophosphatase MutT (NUDIX family)|nr:fold metallo-hydrolase [Candidatus Eremiobacteraeota bacterium]
MGGTRFVGGRVPVSGPTDEIRDAATVIVARDTSEGLQVFMVRRHAGATFLPDRYVFPGGRVDDADRDEAARRLHGSSGDVDAAYAMTAARETFEEVGLLFADRPVHGAALGELRRAMHAGELTFGDVLERLDASIDASQLRYFSRWVTPKAEFATRRFDTRFFVARAPEDQIAEADATEVLDGRWMRPADALAANARGEMGLIFPTIKHLERVEPLRTVDELLRFAHHKTIVTVTPDVQPGPTFVLVPELENGW